GTLSGATSVTMVNGGVTAGATLINQGTLTILPGSSVFNGAFSNARGATPRLQADFFNGNRALTVAQGFTHAGTIDLTATSSIGNSDILTVSSGTLVNTGAITATVGTGGGRTIAAQFDNQGTITTNQPLTINSTGQSRNEGTISVGGGNLTISQSGTGAS